MLIKIDAQAQIDQRQLVDFMNTTVKSGTLGKYQVDPSSVQSTGKVTVPFVQLFLSSCFIFTVFSSIWFSSSSIFFGEMVKILTEQNLSNQISYKGEKN